MKITDLKPRIVAVFAGRFHPFHHGHAEVFRELAGKFGINNTYITTSGKVEPNKSPFSFDDKKIMMKAAGIPDAHVIQEIVPYSPTNLISSLGLDSNKDVLVFGVGEKDMKEDPRFAFTPLRDGSPSYFQRWTGRNLMSFDSKKTTTGERAGHGYVFPVADVEFIIAGKKINSASALRELYLSADDNARVNILHELYLSATPDTLKPIKKIFDKKLG